MWFLIRVVFLLFLINSFMVNGAKETCKKIIINTQIVTGECCVFIKPGKSADPIVEDIFKFTVFGTEILENKQMPMIESSPSPTPSAAPSSHAHNQHHHHHHPITTQKTASTSLNPSTTPASTDKQFSSVTQKQTDNISSSSSSSSKNNNITPRDSIIAFPLGKLKNAFGIVSHSVITVPQNACPNGLALDPSGKCPDVFS